MRAATRIAILLLATVLSSWARSAKAEEPSEHARRDETPRYDKADSPHPEPRVIVTVTSVQGPHDRADVERSARLAWGRIVRCYESSDQRERGMISVELVVARSGKVTRARRIGSTLKSRELVSCLTNAMNGLAMPKGSARSTANAEIHVAPGDRSSGSSRLGHDRNEWAGMSDGRVPIT